MKNPKTQTLENWETLYTNTVDTRYNGDFGKPAIFRYIEFLRYSFSNTFNKKIETAN